MKYWKYSLRLGIFSIAILLISLCFSAHYSVFIWNKMGADAGVLFPALFASWITGLIAIAYNYVFVDMIYMQKTERIARTKKYLPSLLSIPAIFSFVWFCYRWYRGNPID